MVLLFWCRRTQVVLEKSCFKNECSVVVVGVVHNLGMIFNYFWYIHKIKQFLMTYTYVYVLKLIGDLSSEFNVFIISYSTFVDDIALTVLIFVI